MSHLRVKTGVRQDGLNSPISFGIYIDVLVISVNSANIGCKIRAICTGIFLYADNTILLAQPVQALYTVND